jgi:signal transduction histidine kinase
MSERERLDHQTQRHHDLDAPAPAALPPDHVVQFYRSDLFLVETIARFLEAGLRQGDAAVVVATGARLAAVEQVLAGSGLPVAELKATGRLCLRDAHQTLAELMVGDTPDPALFRASVGRLLAAARRASPGGQVRVYGEMVDLLWRQGNEAALLQLEDLWHEVVTAEKIALLCAYDLAASPGAGDGGADDGGSRGVLREISRRHTATWDAPDDPHPLDDHLRRVTEDLVRAVTPGDIAGIGLHTISEALGIEAGALSVVAAGGAAAAGKPDELARARRPGGDGASDGRSLVSIPMMAGDTVLGAMNFELSAFRRLGTSDRAFMQAVADRCAQALERTRLYDVERRAHEQALAREAEMTVLVRLMEAVNRAESLAEVLEPALDAMTEALRVARAAILICDEGGVMRFQAWRALSDGYRAAVEGHCPWAAGDPDPAPVLVDDVEADPAWARYLTLFRQERIRALAFIPLTHQRRLLGKFMLYAGERRLFAQREVELARTIAAQVSQAVVRAQLLRAERAARHEAERRADRTHRLQGVTAGLSGAVTAADVARVVVTQGRAATGGLWIVDEAEERIDLVHSAGYTDGGRESFSAIPLASRLPMPLLDALRTGQPVWIASKGELGARYPQLAAVVAELTVYAVACLPLKRDGVSVGGLAFTFDGAEELDAIQREFLETIAHLGEQALERAHLYDREQRARAEAEAAHQRASFKARASAVLTSSLDFETTLRNVAKLAVPGFADWCAVELGDPAANTTLVALEHVDPALAAAAWQLRQRHAADPAVAQLVPGFLRGGRPVLHHTVDAERLAAAVTHPEQLALLRSLGLGSAISAPMATHDRTIGLVVFARAGTGRRYDVADLETAVMLGQRAAMAVERARLHHQLQSAVRMRDDLIAMVSHDLRNLIGIVSMSAAAIGRGLPAGAGRGKQGKHVDAIGRSVEGMNRLIRDLLDVGSIEAGQLQVDPRPEELGALLAQTLEDLRPLAAARALRLEVALPDQPVAVSCDRQRVFQVLSNLVGNAVKFTPGGGSIVVSSELLSDAVVLSVEDSGPGIEPDHLAHIFDRYYRAAGPERGGRGLGLFISRGLVEAHAGRIWAESILGKGSRFCFTLPRLPAVAQAVAGEEL